jgi:putative membrane protein
MEVRMNSLKWLFAMVIAFGVPSAGAQDKKAAAQLSKEDTLHLKHLSEANLAEVEAGKIAAQKAANPEVKKFGEKMVAEHTKMVEEGKQLAQKKGVKPDEGVDGKHKKNLADLNKKSGADFDREYMEQQVQDHEGALKLVQNVAKDAKDGDIKAMAQKAEPHVKGHLDEARKLRASLNKGDAAKKK